jgi:cell division protein FtsL
MMTAYRKTNIKKGGHGPADYNRPIYVKEGARLPAVPSIYLRLSRRLRLDRFERILMVIILAGTFFCAISQVMLNKEHSERKLHRQLQMQRFLEQKDFQGVFADYRIRKNEKDRDAR